VTYLGPQYENDDPQKAAEIVTSTLAAHPDLAGIFSTNDQGAIGAITGLRQAGAIGRVKLVAYDSAAAEVNAFKNKQISVLIAQDPKREGEISGRNRQEDSRWPIRGEAGARRHGAGHERRHSEGGPL
jgi:ribose transport system substrate-binding protein